MITHTCRSSTCKKCGQTTRRGYSKMACDKCKKDLGLNDCGEHLEVKIFYQDQNNQRKETDHLQFCSWKCCIKFLPKIKSDYFVTLPYLHYDNRKKGLTAKDFFEAIGKIQRSV